MFPTRMNTAAFTVRAGFRPVTVVDASDHCLYLFFEHCVVMPSGLVSRPGNFHPAQYRGVMLWLFVMQRHITNYVLACAVKPGRRKTRCIDDTSIEYSYEPFSREPEYMDVNR